MDNYILNAFNDDFDSISWGNVLNKSFAAIVDTCICDTNHH